MFDLPISVTIEDREYPIRNKGDYRMVLDCFKALNDNQLSQENRIVTALIIFYDNVSDETDLFTQFSTNSAIKSAVDEMMLFFNCGQAEIGAKQPYKLIDWEQDEQLISSAVNSVAQREIRFETYLHWWTFMGYFIAIGDCTLSTIVEIRSKLKKGKKLEKYEQEFRNDNPHYFVWNSSTPDELDANELLRNLWNKEN